MASKKKPLVEYKAGTTFPGVVGRTTDESKPAWPEPKRTEQGAPNVLLIVLDDVGFGHLGCYGSPIATPNLDKLAQKGLRYTSMQTTALCSPSRSCILTGRNHHSNAMAGITEVSMGYPGYNGSIPFENGMLSEALLQKGYNTFAVGKWHLTPAEQTSAVGPFDRWPLGRGFERYYGFLGGDTHQYRPDLIEDNHQVEQKKTPEEGYHLTEDLADKAMELIASAKQLAPDKPFFTYFCTGAGHAPHQVPKEWADQYKGKFDDGWDAYREKVLARQIEMGIFPKGTELSRHDPDVQEWAALPADEKRLYARMMEVFAGFLTHADHHIGRLLDFLEQGGQLDNTLVMVISDNGASPEGGPHGSLNENRFFNNVEESAADNLKAIDDLGGPKYFNHYPWGWAWAGNTPFRRWKRETYRGGTSDPFIVHWPKAIKARGEIRTQFCHAIDIVPTVLELLEIEAPAQVRGVTQSPLQGISLAYSLDDAKAVSRHVTQYFEMLGHRSIYHDGWRAVCPVPGPSFKEAGVGFGEMNITEQKLRELDAQGWELYHIAEDPTETTNLADKRRDKLIEMIATWYVEAGKYNVLPVSAAGTERFALDRPQLAEKRERYVYFPHTAEVPENIAVKVLNRPHTIVAEVEIEHDSEGVLLSHGGNTGGYTLFIQDGRLHYVHNYLGFEEYHVVTDAELPSGAHALRFEFQPTGAADPAHGKGTPGRALLYVDDKLAGEGEIPVTVPIMLGLGGGLAVGRNQGTPVSALYKAPFAFGRGLHRVIVDVSGKPTDDREASGRSIMARQ